MSLKVVMDEVNAIKDALAKETPNTGGSLQWQPSYKNDFALADSSDFPAGGLPDGSATAPQVAADASVATETSQTTGTDPQP